MKTKNLVTLAIACLVVVLLTVVCACGMPLAGTSYMIPAYEGVALGDDFNETICAVYAVAAPEEEMEDFETLFAQTIETMKMRSGMQTVSNVSVSKLGSDKVYISVPTTDHSAADSVLESLTGEGHVYIANADGEAILEGEHIVLSGMGADNSSDTLMYIVSFKFDEEGTQLFADATAEAVGSYISIFCDDQELARATISEPMTDGGAALSFSDFDTARALYAALNGGRLTAVLTAEMEGHVPARVSASQYRMALLALAIVVLAVAIAYIVVFKAAGFVAALTTVLTLDAMLFFLGCVPYLSFGFGSLFAVIAMVAVKMYCDLELLGRANAAIVGGAMPRDAVSAAFRGGVVRILEICGISIAAALLLQYTGSIAASAFTSVFGIGAFAAFLLTLLVTRPLLTCAVDKRAVEVTK